MSLPPEENHNFSVHLECRELESIVYTLEKIGQTADSYVFSNSSGITGQLGSIMEFPFRTKNPPLCLVKDK